MMGKRMVVSIFWLLVAGCNLGLLSAASVDANISNLKVDRKVWRQPTAGCGFSNQTSGFVC
jgi:hypothetical protein